MGNYVWYQPSVAETLAWASVTKGDKGDKGDTGAAGAAGAAGADASLTIDDTANGKTYTITCTNGVLGVTEVV